MTATLSTYEQFLARVEELGFYPLSTLVEGMPSLGEETAPSAWHTGLESDPWQWKDRAATEKRLAYGCILNGHKGFIARRMYPIFVAAFRPAATIQARWEAGEVSQRTLRVWELFEEHGALNISRLRQMIGEKGSGLDSTVQQLQSEFYITVDGNDRKISAKGEPYGWPVIRYRRVADWAPVGWLNAAREWSRAEARQAILDEGMKLSPNLSRADLARKLGF